MTKSQQEQLKQLLTATWDGNLISKTDRDYLVTTGYAQRRKGWNIATPWGVEVAANLKLTHSNDQAVKRPDPFTVVSVSCAGVVFPLPSGKPGCFISHERILDGLPEASLVRRLYNEWADAALKGRL